MDMSPKTFSVWFSLTVNLTDDQLLYLANELQVGYSRLGAEFIGAYANCFLTCALYLDSKY